jgi:hypothetical protein
MGSKWARSGSTLAFALSAPLSRGVRVGTSLDQTRERMETDDQGVRSVFAAHGWPALCEPLGGLIVELKSPLSSSAHSIAWASRSRPRTGTGFTDRRPSEQRGVVVRERGW